MLRLRSLIAAGLLAAVATTAQGQAAPPDTAAIRAALNATSAKLNAAYLAGDAAAVVMFFTDDARAEYYGFPSAAGHAAIQSAYETYFKANKLKVAETTINGVNVLNADLVTAGGTHHTFGSGKPAHAWWRWAAAYRKGADGEYRISYIMAFPDSTK
jgi:ketosteroid isomerase-like protein